MTSGFRFSHALRSSCNVQFLPVDLSWRKVLGTKHWTLLASILNSSTVDRLQFRGGLLLCVLYYVHAVPSRPFWGERDRFSCIKNKFRLFRVHFISCASNPSKSFRCCLRVAFINVLILFQTASNTIKTCDPAHDISTNCSVGNCIMYYSIWWPLIWRRNVNIRPCK